MTIRIENNRSTSSACIAPRRPSQSRRVDIAPTAQEFDDGYHLRILREHFQRDYAIAVHRGRGHGGRRERAANAGRRPSTVVSRPGDGGGDDGGGAATFVLRPRRNPPAVLSALIPGIERYKYIVRFQNGEVCFRDAYHDENFVGRGRPGGLPSSLTSSSSSEGRRARVTERHGSFADRIRKVNERIVEDRRREREERWLREGVYRGGSAIMMGFEEPVC